MRKICLFFLLWTPLVALAAEPEPLDDSCRLKISSYLDVSYNYLVRSNHFYSGTHNREFDINPNGFTLQQDAVTASIQPANGFGGLINLILGRDAFNTASYGINPNYIDNQQLALDVYQLYVQYAQCRSTTMFGKMLSLAGYESTYSPGNLNFSHSLINFFDEPGTLIGVREVFQMNDQIKLTAGVENAWDTVKYFSGPPAIELGITYTPNNKYSFTIDGYTGGQPFKDNISYGPIGRRTLIDMFGTINITDQLSFIANYDYLTQSRALFANGNIGSAKSQGVAAYLNYQFCKKWRTAFRAEIFSDAEGWRTGVAQCIKEVTLTLGFDPIKDLEFRLEARHDFANTKSIVNKNGINYSANQQSYALDMVYNFP